jgi:protein SCO1
VRLPLLVALAALVLVAAGCGGSDSSSQQAQPTTTSVAASRFAGSELPSARPAPEIALHDAHGRLVRLSDQRGRYVLVTFIYSHCPDVCPLIASNLNSALRALGPSRRDVSVLAVSVDPRGDTPAAIRTYEQRMHLLPQFHYLIGSRNDLLRVWRDYDVLAVARNKELVDHVAYTVLVDRQGKRRVLYDANVQARQVVHDLRVLRSEKQSA